MNNEIGVGPVPLSQEEFRQELIRLGYRFEWARDPKTGKMTEYVVGLRLRGPIEIAVRNFVGHEFYDTMGKWKWAIAMAMVAGLVLWIMILGDV